MIYDVFPYLNESELLNIRLLEFVTIPEVRHVLVESPYTFTMKEKPYHYDEQAHLGYRIERIKILKDEMKGLCRKDSNDIHFVERFQRDYAMKYLHAVCKDNDLVIIGDVDEIPLSSSIKEFMGTAAKAARFQTRLYRYYYNLYFQDWRFPHIVRWRELKNWESMYEYRINAQPTIIKGGWHFSSVGNFEDIWYKFNSFGAANESRVKKKLNKQYIKRRIADKLHPFKNGKAAGQVAQLSDMPKYIQDHLLQFKDKLIDG